MLFNKHIYKHIFMISYLHILMKKNPVLVILSNPVLIIITNIPLKQKPINLSCITTETNLLTIQCITNELTGFFKKKNCLQNGLKSIYHLFCRPWLVWQRVIIHFRPWHMSYLFMTSFGIPSNWCYWSLYSQSIWLITKLL